MDAAPKLERDRCMSTLEISWPFGIWVKHLDGMFLVARLARLARRHLSEYGSGVTCMAGSEYGFCQCVQYNLDSRHYYMYG